MPAIQFFGIDSVMQAAENIKRPAWAIFINRQLFTKYEGDNDQESLSLLQNNLASLAEAGTAAIYTIKFFEAEPGKVVKINERTVCDGGSFNFKLIEPEEREAKLISGSSQYGIIAKMQKDIDLLKKEKQDLEDQAGAEPETIGSVFMDLLKNPAQLGQLINVGRSMIGLPVQDYGAAIGALPGPVGNVSEIDMDRLAAAIDILEKRDPKLIEHLEKLAKMATQNPGQFSATVSMLDLT